MCASLFSERSVTIIRITTLFTEMSIKIVPQPFYILDFALCDLLLFPKVKENIGSSCFEGERSVRVLDTFTFDDFQVAFTKLLDQSTKDPILRETRILYFFEIERLYSWKSLKTSGMHFVFPIYETHKSYDALQYPYILKQCDWKSLSAPNS